MKDTNKVSEWHLPYVVDIRSSCGKIRIRETGGKWEKWERQESLGCRCIKSYFISRKVHFPSFAFLHIIMIDWWRKSYFIHTFIMNKTKLRSKCLKSGESVKSTWEMSWWGQNWKWKICGKHSADTKSIDLRLTRRACTMRARWTAKSRRSTWPTCSARRTSWASSAPLSNKCHKI